LDGAYNTGIREADRIASRPWNVGRGVNQTSNWANPHAFASGWMDRDYFQEKGGGADVDPSTALEGWRAPLDPKLYSLQQYLRSGLLQATAPSTAESDSR